MVLEKLDIHMQKTGSIPTPYTKIHLQRVKDLNLSAKTIQLSKASIRENLHDIEFVNDFLDMILKA
jgi:hypothetical protein